MVKGRTVVIKAKPRLSWEPLEGGSLLLKVVNGERETIWKLRKSTNNETLYQIFGEIMCEIDPLDHTPGLLAEHKLIDGGKDPQDRWEEHIAVAKDAVTEEMSKAALDAKAREVSAQGGQWWNDEVNMLPFKGPAE